MYTPLKETGDYTLEDGAALCTLIEPVCEPFGFHVALTGGCLYGSGGRKDIDILFYRIRQVHEPDTKGLILALKELGIHLIQDFGFCKKFIGGTKIKIDALFPEDYLGGYPVEPLMKKDDGAVT